MKRKLFATVAVLCLAPLTPQVAGAQVTVYEYTAKFICGVSDGRILAHGNYQTAINVHNTSTRSAEIIKRFVIALPNEKAGPMSDTVHVSLPKDRAFEIDGPDIRRYLKMPDSVLLKGFVVIRSLSELDVVAVYTVEGARQEGPSMCIERVPVRKRSGYQY
jgi:hypothetical protein